MYAPHSHQRALWRGNEGDALHLEATTRLTDALQQHPSNTHLRLQLAQVHAVKGKQSLATALAAAAPSAAPLDADAHALALLGARASSAGAAQATGLVDVLRCDPGALDALAGTTRLPNMT